MSFAMKFRNSSVIEIELIQDSFTLVIRKYFVHNLFVMLTTS